MSEEFSSLLMLARQGDREALVRLSEQYEKKLRMVARVQLGPALRPYLDSQDLVQSVHRSLMLGLRNDKFDISCPETLIALTFTMLRRKIARHWRRMQRQKRQVMIEGDTLDQGDTGEMVDLLTSLSTPRTEPNEEVQFRDSVSFLCKHLDDTERHIIDLRLQGYAAPEIATQIGLTSVNVRVRMTRLRQRLTARGVLDDWL